MFWRRQAPATLVCASLAVAESNECEVTYLLGGDPDRPVYLHIHVGEDEAAAEVVEVWTPPTCRARVDRADSGGSVEVEVSPVRRHRVA